MFLLYFLLWVIFNGNFTLEIAVFGVVIAAAVFAFTCKFADYSIEKEKMLFRNFFRIIRYVVVLVIEIVKANFAVVHLIWSEERDADLAFATFQGSFMAAAGRSALANAITLTPGTITVQLEDNVYTVHCLDESLAEGIDESIFAEMMKEIEKGGH